MATSFVDHLLEGDHASRPAFGAVPQGTLYACSDHDLIYQSDGSTAWSTWATLGGGVTDHGALTGLTDDDHTQYLKETDVAAKGDLFAASANDTVGVLTAGTNGHVLTADSGESLGVKWAAASGSAPTSSESVLTTDVTMTNADQYYDSGLSLSLAAGTWFLWGKVGIRVANSGATAIIARLVNSDASVIYDGTAQNVPANGGQEWFLPIGARITLGSTTTVKVQCEDSARAASIILGDSNTDDAPDNQLSRLIAVAVS